jgi:hypothetical protein
MNKGVIKICKSEKDRQYNSQKKKDKRTRGKTTLIGWTMYEESEITKGQSESINQKKDNTMAKRTAVHKPVLIFNICPMLVQVCSVWFKFLIPEGTPGYRNRT